MITLESNGVEQSLEAWGITRATLRLISLSSDELTIEIEDADMFADQPFDYDDVLNLYKDGVRIFSGTVAKLPVVGSVGGEAWTYTAYGPWFQMERVVYQQLRKVYTSDVSPAPVNRLNSRAMLFSDGTVQGHTTNDVQAANAISYAGIFAPIGVGSIILGATPPLQEVRDMTCAEVVMTSCKWTPDAVSWFDYTQTPPKIYIKRRSTLSAVTVDPLNASSNLVTSVKITPREDLNIPGVQFNFEETVVVDSVQKVILTVQQAGLINGKDVLIHTFQLQGATTDKPEPVPSGLAFAFWNTVNVLHYEGEITATEQECSFFVKTGNVINFSSGTPSKYQTMKALVQQVAFDLVNGITQVTFGPPQQLGPQDFNALLASSRSGGNNSTFPGSGAPSDGTGNTPSGSNTNPFGQGNGSPFDIEDCDGNKKTVIAKDTP